MGNKAFQNILQLHGSLGTYEQHVQLHCPQYVPPLFTECTVLERDAYPTGKLFVDVSWYVALLCVRCSVWKHLSFGTVNDGETEGFFSAVFTESDIGLHCVLAGLAISSTRRPLSTVAATMPACAPSAVSACPSWTPRPAWLRTTATSGWSAATAGQVGGAGGWSPGIQGGANCPCAETP